MARSGAAEAAAELAELLPVAERRAAFAEPGGLVRVLPVNCAAKSAAAGQAKRAESYSSGWRAACSLSCKQRDRQVYRQGKRSAQSQNVLKRRAFGGAGAKLSSSGRLVAGSEHEGTGTSLQNHEPGVARGRAQAAATL